MRGLLAATVTGRTVLVVAHAGVIRALGMMTRNGAEPRIGHAAGRRIVVGPDGVTDKGPAFA
jgi:broad specificity phosphatase PhoE